MSDRDLAQQQSITRQLHDLTVKLRQRNLDNAIRLAQQAAKGVGPLVDHFAELGRRYADDLLVLRVIDGGRA